MKPTSKAGRSMVFYAESESDEDEEDMDVDKDIVVSVVESFSQAPSRKEVAPVADARTSKRIQGLTSPAYIHSLLSLLNSPTLAPEVVPYLLSLSLAFPSSVPQTILASSAGQGLVRDLYRNYVRRSSIGKDGSGTTAKALTATPAKQEWPALLLLVELYGTSLMTMGDDEFFGTSSSSLSSSALSSIGSASLSGSSPANKATIQRNPLSLDELASFGRQLLNVSWVLWWQLGDVAREGGPGSLSEVESATKRLGWESVRGRITRCLTSIHSRE
jgi:ubiquitin-protein ligase E3 C